MSKVICTNVVLLQRSDIAANTIYFCTIANCSQLLKRWGVASNNLKACDLGSTSSPNCYSPALSATPFHVYS